MEEQHSLPGAMIDTTAPEAEMQPACTEAETQPVDSSEVPHFSEEVFADVFAAFYRNPPTWDFEAVGRFKITDSTKVKDMRLLILESFKSLSRHDEYNDFVFLKVVGTSPQLKLSTFNSNDDTSLRDILSSWGDLYVSPRRRLPNSAISTLATTQDTSVPPTIRSSWLGWLGGGFAVIVMFTLSPVIRRSLLILCLLGSLITNIYHHVVRTLASPEMIALWAIFVTILLVLWVELRKRK